MCAGLEEDGVSQSDHEIMKIAMTDIGFIQDVLSLRRPREYLKDAGNLMLAYTRFLEKLRVVHNRTRPWESLPDAEVCGASTAACDVGKRSDAMCVTCRPTPVVAMNAGSHRGAA